MMNGRTHIALDEELAGRAAPAAVRALTACVSYRYYYYVCPRAGPF